MPIKNWSPTPASNNSPAPYGAPEGMAISSGNDTMRQIMADVRADYESPTWKDLGHTPTYASATAFTISGDVTSYYTVNRRLKLADASTLYATVTASAYSSPNTTVTVSVDSGSLSASLSAVEISCIDPSNYPITTDAFTGLAPSASTDTTNADNITSGTLSAARIASSSITKAKIEDVADGKLLGNVSGGAAAPAEVSIQTDIASATSGEIADAAAVKSYVDSLAGVNMSVNTYATNSIITSIIPIDNTIPQNTEGDEVLTVSITPRSASSTLFVEASVPCSNNTNNPIAIAIFRDSGADAIAAQLGSSGTNESIIITASGEVTSGSTSSTTFKLRVGNGGSVGTVTVNPAFLGGVNNVSLKVTEIQ